MTSPDPVERRLAAILAADVEGYSRHIGRDDVAAMRMLMARRESAREKIAAHRGRTVDTAGDSILAEFASVVDAVACALEIQKTNAEAQRELAADARMNLRIGIHIGDVVVRGAELFGDGVNTAARLQALAEPGGVTVSGAVWDQVRRKLPIEGTDLGPQTVKNIEEPVPALKLRYAQPPAEPAAEMPTLALPDKPSIAVLPFQNMSGDPEQEYFADGMVEEIITALSRFRNLFVIARNSSFTYKGRAVDVKQVGRELGVRYVLEGSVRKASNRIRITGQLIDATTGAHIWADRFDGALEDVFELQDQVTQRVISAVTPTMERAEIERATRKRPDNLDAYDYYLRALALFNERERESLTEGLRLAYRAIEIDPGYAAAYGLASHCFFWRKANGWLDRSTTSEADRLARQAVALANNDAIALSWGGSTLAYVCDDLRMGAVLMERALELNPNLSIPWLMSGWIKVWQGQPELAIERLERATRISPLDPYLFGMQAAMAHAHFFAGRYEEAIHWATLALQQRPRAQPVLRILAASLALAGREQEATDTMQRLQAIYPELRISNLWETLGAYPPKLLAHYQQALRKAGLPE